MANESLNILLRYIRQLAKAPPGSQASDQELLQRFRQERDEAAFEALVRRHGAMVFKVAERTLNNGHDAEDVFQATFLTLACKAGSLRKPGSVALLAAWGRPPVGPANARRGAEPLRS